MYKTLRVWKSKDLECDCESLVSRLILLSSLELCFQGVGMPQVDVMGPCDGRTG